MGHSIIVILFYLFIFVSNETINLNIDSNNMISLIPQFGQVNSRFKTKWNLYTKYGSKLIIDCSFFTTKCSKSMIKINTGDQYFKICPENKQFFRNISHQNFMSVTIVNYGNEPLTKCKVTTTKPFTHMDDKNINSIEDGKDYGAVKQATCDCGWSNKNRKRIVQGFEAAINEFPFIVRIKFKSSGNGFCGGSIVTKRHILTAGHCGYYGFLRNISVLIGEHDITKQNETDATKEIDVQKVIIHPQYEHNGIYNDIAILVLNQDIEFTRKVGRVCMPKGSVSEDLVGQYTKVMGWGLTRDETLGGKASTVLRKVNLKIIDSDICKVIYDVITTNQICTYRNSKDSCNGDSGGPLIMADENTKLYKQIAIVAFGRRCAYTDPSINTDIRQFMDWIRQEIEGTGSSSELCY